jgi:DNA-binding transcriptional ArsR family regulator
MTQPAISKHLRVLERAGLIERGRRAQWRPRRLRASPLRDVADWVDPYRPHWEESFERLDAYLRDLQANQEPGKGDDDDRDSNRPG